MIPEFSFFKKIILTLFSGLILGAVLAFAALNLIGPRNGLVSFGNWHSLALTASSDAGIWERAWIAGHGLFALPKEAAIYFTRTKDDSGKLLSDKCTYIISGSDLPAEWWSITAYDEAGFLPQNPGPYSLTKTQMNQSEKSWSVEIPDEKTINLREAGNFSLMLRIYMPGKIQALPITVVLKACR